MHAHKYIGTEEEHKHTLLKLHFWYDVKHTGRERKREKEREKEREREREFTMGASPLTKPSPPHRLISSVPFPHLCCHWLLATIPLICYVLSL